MRRCETGYVSSVVVIREMVPVRVVVKRESEKICEVFKIEKWAYRYFYLNLPRGSSVLFLHGILQSVSKLSCTSKILRYYLRDLGRALELSLLPYLGSYIILQPVRPSAQLQYYLNTSSYYGTAM